jgi:hypothetical protein
MEEIKYIDRTKPSSPQLPIEHEQALARHGDKNRASKRAFHQTVEGERAREAGETTKN